MTTHYKTQAIVFKKNDINESDRIFSVFTADFGKIDIFAKAIRKPTSKLRGGIDIFFLSEIEFIQGKNKKTLTDVVAIEKFKNIYKNLEKFKIANAIVEILYDLIKGEEKDEDLFIFLRNIFAELNSCSPIPPRCLLLYYYFLWNILSFLGYHSEVKKCANCQSKLFPYNIYFSNKEGGIICRNCLDKDGTSKKINSDIVKILRIILSKNWSMLSKIKIGSASWKLFEEVSRDYYFYILNRKANFIL